MRDEIAVFTFASLSIPAGVTVQGARNTNSRPMALLSQSTATVAGTINVSGLEGRAAPPLGEWGRWCRRTGRRRRGGGGFAATSGGPGFVDGLSNPRGLFGVSGGSVGPGGGGGGAENAGAGGGAFGGAGGGVLGGIPTATSL